MSAKTSKKSSKASEPVTFDSLDAEVPAPKKSVPKPEPAPVKPVEPVAAAVTESKDSDSEDGPSVPKDPSVVFGAIVRYHVKQYIKENPLKNHELVSGEGLEYLSQALRETADDVIDFALSVLTQAKKKTFSSSEMRLGLRAIAELPRDSSKDPTISVPAAAKTKESRLQTGLLRYLKKKVNGDVSVEELAKYRASRDAAAVLHHALIQYAQNLVRKADALPSAAAVKRLTNVHIAEARGVHLEVTPKVRAKKAAVAPVDDDSAAPAAAPKPKGGRGKKKDDEVAAAIAEIAAADEPANPKKRKRTTAA
jgi:histone H3/H4